MFDENIYVGTDSWDINLRWTDSLIDAEARDVAVLGIIGYLYTYDRLTCTDYGLKSSCNVIIIKLIQ